MLLLLHHLPSLQVTLATDLLYHWASREAVLHMPLFSQLQTSAAAAAANC
jgi:hypothetical protein